MFAYLAYGAMAAGALASVVWGICSVAHVIAALDDPNFNEGNMQ